MCDSKILVKLDRARVSNDENYKALLAKFDSCEDSFGNSEWYLCSSIVGEALYEIFFWGDVVCKIFYQMWAKMSEETPFTPYWYRTTYRITSFTSLPLTHDQLRRSNQNTYKRKKTDSELKAQTIYHKKTKADIILFAIFVSLYLSQSLAIA